MHINPDKPVFWDLKSREFIITATGGSVFVASMVALAALAYFLPAAMNVQNIVSYSAAGTLMTAGFVCFVVGMVLNRKRQNAERDARIEEILKADETPPTEPVDIEEVVVEVPKISYREYIGQVIVELNPLFNSIEHFLKALIIAKHKSSPPNLTSVHHFVDVLKQEVNGFLQSPQEVLRVAINFATYAMTDLDKMGELLSRSDQEFLQGLPTVLSEVKDEDRIQGELLKEILTVITQGKGVSSPFQQGLQILRDTHGNLMKAKRLEERMRGGSEEDRARAAALVSAKNSEYQAALSAVIDYLFSKTRIRPEWTDKWTSHLIPHFLDQWRSTLFPQLGENINGLGGAAFQAGGVFDNDAMLKQISPLTWQFAQSLGRGQVKDTLKGAMTLFPINDARKERLAEAAVPAFYTAINTVIALLTKNDQFRPVVQKALDEVCKTPVVNEDSWHAYSTAYSGLFEAAASKLDPSKRYQSL